MNFETPPTISKIELDSEKERAWQEQIAQLEKASDRLGQGIDPGIMETVAALNILGVETYASCEGHMDHGIAAPWIDIEASEEPNERFEKDNELLAEISQKYGIEPEKIRRAYEGKAIEAQKEWSQRRVEYPETVAYKKWRGANEQLVKRTSSLLEEFYRERRVPDNILLTINESGETSGARIYNGGEDYRPVSETTSEKERQALAERLQQYQAEMRAFTKFLKDKFFGSTANQMDPEETMGDRTKKT